MSMATFSTTPSTMRSAKSFAFFGSALPSTTAFRAVSVAVM
jgi:hypothetical protein